MHDARALEYLIDVIGNNNVMLGTDYPFPLGELDCGKLIESMTMFDDHLKVSRNINICLRKIYITHKADMM